MLMNCDLSIIPKDQLSSSSMQHSIFVLLLLLPSEFTSHITTTAFISANRIDNCRPTPPAPPVTSTTWLATFYKRTTNHKNFRKDSILHLFQMINLNPTVGIHWRVKRWRIHERSSLTLKSTGQQLRLFGRFAAQIDFAVESFLFDPILETPTRLFCTGNKSGRSSCTLFRSGTKINSIHSLSSLLNQSFETFTSYKRPLSFSSDNSSLHFTFSLRNRSGMSVK